MEIIAVKIGQPWWDETIEFAKICPWPPGRRLAERMTAGDYKEWEQVFAAVRGGKVIGFCVFEENGTVPPDLAVLHPFINQVFVDETFRGQRVSQALVNAAIGRAKELGFERVYLKSEHRGLYEKYGFRKIADFVPVTGRADQLFEYDIMP